MKQLTKKQAVIISGYTMICCCPFKYLHEEIEKRLGRPVWTHELPSLADEIKEAFKEDFLSLCYEEK